MTRAALHVLQFTDTHIFADEAQLFGGVNTRCSFLAARDKALAERRRCDLILITGDLAAQADSGAYSWLAAQLLMFEVPIYCLPGNHDIGEVMQPLVCAAGWNFGGSLTIGGWQIVLLDSTVRGEAYGRLTASELGALDDALARHPNLPTLVALHHQPVPIGSAWMDAMKLQDAARFWTVIDNYPQVRGVLWGHIHQNYDAFRHRVRLLATPSTCVQFAARSVDFAIDSLPAGFRWLRLSSGGDIATDVVRV